MANIPLLARYAEAVFWLARYVERAENLARILDVNSTFSRDLRGARDWLPVLQINSDQARFEAQYPAPTAEAVLTFYVTDRDNPTSIISAIAAARENARTLRPVISTEMWAQMNIFYKWLSALDGTALAPSSLARLFARIKEGCQTHIGITDGTLHRDQGSYFYRLGRHIERADQTTRLLDIKYHLLLPGPAVPGSKIDLVQWDALLRSAAGHYAYMRVMSGAVTPSGVAGFLLLQPHFPRSVSFCVSKAARLLEVIRSRHELPGGAVAAHELGCLRAGLGSITIEQVISEGLHEYLDQIQRNLIAVTSNISSDFFRWGIMMGGPQSQLLPAPLSLTTGAGFPVSSQSQSQSQGDPTDVA
ncbi:alpha-E domain-containing protein [Belnapia moabensis]|uniref:alpha-E domain-containing protein n=1 Tax=Belnapia moabensis TaxID=365533 RepID=UPI000AB50A7A|nr:alpha-E domain-containing protein [Belnapia moabensis]